jgi:SAM-dependent methyltransferase
VRPPEAGSHFQVIPRAALRSTAPWNRLAYISAALPAAIAELAPELGVGPTSRVLDYGSADSPYRSLFPAGTDWVGADLPGNPDASVELRADGSLPLADESVDAVISTQVLEHVRDPALYLAECSRVLRPGGRLLLSTHGMMVYHPDPDDYWRWTCAGLKLAVGQAGFEIRRFDGIMGLAATGLQFFQDAVYWKLPRPVAHVFALVMQLSIKLVDRLQGPGAKELNALVFALVAEKR